ncbi:MAG: heme-binding protein [Gammaproteobacteria bacterium]
MKAKRAMNLLAGAALAASMAPALAQLPTEKVRPMGLALEAAQAALASCEQAGYKVSVAVVDRAGITRVLLRGDGAGPHTTDSSSRKAYTSASLRRATLELAKMVSENPMAAGVRNLNDKVLILGGGLPIKAGEEVIGGIGVGGAPGGDKDEVCAQAGIDKIKDRLQ